MSAPRAAAELSSSPVGLRSMPRAPCSTRKAATAR